MFKVKDGLRVGSVSVIDSAGNILTNANTATSATKLSASKTISLTGVVTGSVSTDFSSSPSITTVLTNTSVTPGTYTSVTVGADGRITAGTSPSFLDTTTGDARYLQLSGTAAMTGALTLSGDPTQPLHAATKQYVDNAVQGVDHKPSVLVATTANITLSGTQTIDGIAVVAGDRVLVKDQTTTSQNGIYVVASGTWSRATDMDAWAEVPAAFVFVEKGAQGDTSWVCTSDPGGTLGSTAITWTQFGSAGSYTGSNGITKVGNDFQLTGQALALHNLATTGLIALTAAGSVTGRTISPSGSGISVSNGDGVSGNPTISLSTGMSNLAGLSWSTGVQIPSLTASNTWALKTVGTASGNILDKAAGDTLYLPLAGGTLTGTLTTSAGTTSAGTAPIKLVSGSNMTTPEAGAVEWDGTNLYVTQTTGPTRKTVAYTDSAISGNTTGSAAKWTNARTVTFATGDVSGSFTLDGSADVANVAMTVSALADRKLLHSDRKLVLLGSSMTWGQGASDYTVGGGSSLSWAGKLKTTLESRGWTVINKGVPGNSTADALARIYTDVVALNPTACVISLNFQNDAFVGSGNKPLVVATFFDNIRKMVSILKQNGIMPVVAGPYPNNNYTSADYPYVRAFQNFVETLDCPTLDFLSTIGNSDGTYLSGTYYDDAHANDTGYDALYRSIPLSMFEHAGQQTIIEPLAFEGGLQLAGSGSGRPLVYTPSDQIGSWTVGFWAQVNETSKSLFGVTEASGFTRLRSVDAGGNTEFAFTTASGTECDSGIAVLPAKWRHFAIRYNRVTGIYTLFIDGTQAGSTAFYASSTPTEFVFGDRTDGGGPANMAIRGITLHRTALTANVIAKMAKGMIQKSGLDLYCPLNDPYADQNTTFTNYAPTNAKLIAGPGITVLNTDGLGPNSRYALSTTAANASTISSGTLSSARLPAFTGDVTTSAGSSATTLATVNSNVGTFGNATVIPVVTVNGKGLVTAVSTAALTSYLPTSGGTLTGALTLNADPTNALHAATKQYVDNVAQGLDAKASVRAATTGNINIGNPGTSSFDGVTLSAGDRLLVRAQSILAENGIYVFNGSASALTRASDMNTWAEVGSAFVFVELGTLYAATGWVASGVTSGVIDTNSIQWFQFSGAGTYTASNGVTLSSSDFRLTGQALALHNAAWTSGTQVLTLTGSGTVTLKTVGSASGNILDKTAGDALYHPLLAYTPANKGGDTFTGTVLIDNGGSSGRLRLLTTGGKAYIQGGDPSGDDVGGKLVLSGYNATTLDTLEVLSAKTYFTNHSPQINFGGGVGKTTVDSTTPGLELVAGGMNTTSQYTPMIKFMSSDAEFTTENPKLLSYIVGRARQSYTLDTTSWMSVEVFTSPANAGTSNTAVQSLSIRSDNIYIGASEYPAWHSGNDGDGSGLDADLLDGAHGVSIASALRAGLNVTGGGTVTFDNGANLSWTQRFLIISNTRGAKFSTSGYFDITQPANGTAITGVGGASSTTWGANGINLGSWQALYYILPIGSGSSSVAANFRIASYTSDVDIPYNWFLVAVRNGDTGQVHVCNGLTLSVNQSLSNTYSSAFVLNSDKLDNLDSTAFAQLTGGSLAAFTGAVSTTQSFDSTKAGGQAFSLRSGTAGTEGYILMSNSAGVARWAFNVGGDGSGNDITFRRYNSSGVSVDFPFKIYSSDGSLDCVLKNGAWYNSADGVNRLNFTASGRSYYKSGDGTHEWRNSSDVAKMNLDSSGNLTLQGTLTATSDERLKENVRDLDDGLDLALRMRPVLFDMNDREQIGFVAQELEPVVPQVVVEGENGYLSVAYQNLTAVAIGALQGLHGKVQRLEARIAELEQRLGDDHR